MILLLSFVALPAHISAHPHCYILNTVKFIFDEEGLSSIRLDWEFDDFFASQILGDCDFNGDGVLSDPEKDCIKSNYFDALEEYSYFTFIKVNGRPLKIEMINDFTVSAMEGSLLYQYSIPCPVQSTMETKKVSVALYDPTFYCAMHFPGELPVMVENAGELDHDYQVYENVDEAYYYDQIHPWQTELVFCQPPCSDEEESVSASTEYNRKNDQNPSKQVAETVPGSNSDIISPEKPIAASRESASLRQRIIKYQKTLYDRMAELARSLKGPEKNRHLILLLGIAFLYGVIHAAGPGHGKAFASSFIIARGPRLGKALLFGVLIAIFHGLSAVLLVLALRTAMIAFTGPALDQVEYYTKLISFSTISLMGLVLFVKSIREWRRPQPVVLVDDKKNGRRSVLTMAAMVGMVPCPGVVLVLLFSLSLDILGAGILMAVCQTAGMALTISVVTVLVTVSRRGAVGILSKSDKGALVIERILELAASLAVLGIGLFFLTGLQK